MNETVNPAHFTHLQTHSHYTLLGGTATVSDLVKRAVSEGMSALALTDTAVLIGAVQFSQKCTQAGLKPIIGLTVPVALPEREMKLTPNGAGNVVLLAKDASGYRSLCRISSFIQTSPQRDRLLRHGVNWALLKENRDGLFCLDGGRQGWTARFLRAGNQQAAVRYASRLGGVFAESACLSLELHQPEDTAVARELINIGSRFGLAAVAVQPIYVLNAADTAKLRLLAAIDQNCRLQDVPEETMPNWGETAVSLHWQTAAQIADKFHEFPEAVAQIREIVTHCKPCLPDGRPIWPKLDLPKDQTVANELATRALAGLQEKGVDGKRYQPRLRREIESINNQGFAPLFLLVADITRFARETRVPVNTRGSVANSLVAYCLGITQVDPVEHDLLFERFLNPARANLPDIDLDFCSRRRDEVLHYVRAKYGEDRVALVATISTMQPKSAIRETAKAYGYDSAGMKRLSALAPRYWHPDPRRRGEFDLDELLASLDDGRDREIIQTAFEIVGLPHHLSIHPGGIVITPADLTDVVPLQLAPKGFLTTQYDFRDIELIGLPKMDLLGIRALTVLADAAELVRTNHDPDFELSAIDLTDGQTAVTLTNADTIGVFQCESTGAKRTLRQLQAKNVRDLAVANAFFKPGPALGGMAQAFVRRYRGQEKVRYLHPALEPILGQTHGVLLFQEQILRIATEIAGLSWAEADKLRRGMSKFKAKEMQTVKLRFVRGCQEKSDLTAEQAETLWQQVEPFAGYGFNQGHATAYADISYRSAYLKTHYPAEFLCARLADHGGFHHPAIYIAEAQRLGIDVRPPHINFSNRKFSLTYAEASQSPTLWMGLGQIRDLRRTSVREIVQQRPYHNLRDLLTKVTLQQKEILHLIQCGALDGLAESRAAMLVELEQIMVAGSARQMSFGFAQVTAVPPEDLAQRLTWEEKLLGWPVSANPVELVKTQTADDVPLSFLPRLKNQKTTIVGVRLPGWTGGRGFYLGDGTDFVVVKPASKSSKKLPRWQPLRLHGLWREDEWGNGWFEMVGNEVYNLRLLG